MPWEGSDLESRNDSEKDSWHVMALARMLIGLLQNWYILNAN